MTAISEPLPRTGAMSRRSLMIFGGTVALTLAGCTGGNGQSSGRGHNSGSAPATPKPTPLPGTVEAAQRENDLAAFATAALDRFDSGLSTAERNLLTNLRDAHLGHATALALPDPFGPAPTAATTSTAPTPSASATPHSPGSSPKTALARLHSLETKAASAYSQLSLGATGPENQLGDLVLLWGSLATASSCYAEACSIGHDPGSRAVGDHRRTLTVPRPDKAIQDLLQQCYAIIFGYQAAIAALSGERADHARSSLEHYRGLRDQLAERLTDMKASVPVPHAAYRLPVQPTTDPRAARLINVMQTRLLPYLGQWLATAGSDDRKDSLQTMITTGRDALAWSPKIIVWPGYLTS